MVFDFSGALIWILFLAPMPLAFFWLRRGQRILFRRDFSEVALRGGTPPPGAGRFACYNGVANLMAGGVTVATTLLVVVFAVPCATWSSIAGSTIWSRFCAAFIISRYARKPVGKGAAP